MTVETPCPIISTGFIADTAETASEFPSVGQNSSAFAFQAVYWRCIAVFLFSARLNNPESEILLFSNITPPVIDGVSIDELCRRLRVSHVQLPLTRRVPGTKRWGSVFYVLDILTWMLQERTESSFALFDNDVVVTAPLASLFEELQGHQFGGYRMNYPADHAVNGVSPNQAASIRSRIAGVPTGAPPPIYGGELFAANLRQARRLVPKIEQLWQYTVHSAKETPRIATEEHFWSIFFDLHGLNVADSHGAIKRIATYRRFTTTVPGDEHIPAWHLPAEKRLGFVDMFYWLAKSNFPLEIGTADFHQRAMAIFGIPRRGIAKRVRDDTRRTLKQIGRWLKPMI